MNTIKRFMVKMLLIFSVMGLDIIVHITNNAKLFRVTNAIVLDNVI